MGGLSTRVWRWSAAVLTAVGLVLVVVGLPHASASSPTSRSAASLSCPAAVRRLGTIAFVARGRVELIDLARCRITVRQASGANEVRFSSDGRWLAHGNVAAGGHPSGPVVVPGHGGAGAARSPLGKGIVAWGWSKHGSLLYGITSTGSLVSAPPAGGRRVIASSLPASASLVQNGPLALSPDGQRAAVDVSSCSPSTVGEIDAIDLHTGVRTVVVRKAGDFFTFAGWSSDGRWLLFWAASMCSGSLAADGWPLEAVPAGGGTSVRVVPHMLLYDDFLSWCGNDLIAAAGRDRETNTQSKLLSIAPPGWHARTIQPARALSWVSPACAPGGHVLVAAAGPNNAPGIFGQEDRSIWLLRAGGAVVRRLSDPPSADLSDEAPRFSRNGRWILFVRSRVLTAGFNNSSRDTIELARRSGAGGAIPIVSFTSGDFSFYDHFDWPYEIAWYQP